METKFLETVAKTMDVDVSEISMDTTYGVYGKWDSLMMFNIIIDLEEEFSTTIPIEKISKIKTLYDLYQLIKG